jgi:hypothetical protein
VSALSERWVIAHTRKYHGLGNRVRAVLGSRVVARREGRRFAYVWPTGKTFGARFDELWEVPDPVVTAAVSRALALRYPFKGNDVTAWLDDATRQERVWQIRTPHALLLDPPSPGWTDDLRSLRPAPSVADRVAAFHGDHLATAPYVGVMVRTHPHSHAETLEASPLRWYVDRLRALRSAHPDLVFFVSADTPDGLATLQREVPGCVALQDKGDYNTRRALQSSVVDLYLLAASLHVVGPHYSSFPELAQHLGGPGLRLETSRTAPAQAFESGPLSAPADPLRPHLRAPVSLP